MNKFITHEAIAAGSFARNYGPPNSGVWESELSNLNGDVLDFYLQRLEKDYSDLHAKQRKPWTGKDVVL